MPELNYELMLRCLSDVVTQVRDLDGNLLGCVPKVPNEHQAPYITSSTGQNFELRISAQMCVCVDTKLQDPRTLPGFVAVDPKNMDVGAPVPGTNPDYNPGEDPDLGQPV